MLIDLHCDTIYELMAREERSLAKNDLCVDLDKMDQSSSFVQCFALFVDLKESTCPYERVTNMAQRLLQEVNCNSDRVTLLKKRSDLMNLHQSHKHGALMTVEEGGVLEGKLERLAELYQLGVRMMTLTWNYSNQLAHPSCVDQTLGLTSLGFEAVEQMEQLGILVDVSHLSDAGVRDVAAVAKRPFLASHSNCRSVWEHWRNLPDELIHLIAESGGVIGLNFAQSFLGSHKISRIEDMIRHLRHLYQVGGKEVLAIGTDFDGIPRGVEIDHLGQMNRLFEALQQAGFKEDLIEAIAWRNADRLFEQSLTDSVKL